MSAENIVDLWKDRIEIRRRVLAKAIAEGDIDAPKIAHGRTGFALNLVHRACELCGGDFAPIGWARSWLDGTGELKFAHMGCASEAHNWAEMSVE